MRLAFAVSALLLAVPTALLFAGEETTLAARPPTADEIAAKILSPAPSDPETLDRVIAGVSPELLRATVAAIRERVARAPAPPVRIDAPTDVAAPAEAPALPAPVPASVHGRGVNFEVRFLDMPRQTARALLGSEPGGDRPAVRPATAADVAGILRSVEAESTVEFVTSACMTTYDGQRANVDVLTKVAYIDDYEVQAGIANPIVKNAMDGLALEVRPVLSADGKTMRLDLSTKARRTTSPIAVEEIVIPGVIKPVEVQRPEILTAEWSRSLTMPDGGALLVGGWA